ncbi:MAG TPA: efflux RND transporter periplasmic adaptor subunit [Pirellulaceae bacterium]|nr:efflux RND transporter periplasmic adaptor subunit [Pirellulaceae bacterium]
MADHPGRLRRRKAIWLAFICLWLGLHSGCRQEGAPRKAQDASKAELPVIEAELLVVAPSILPATVRSQGSLVADDVTVVGAKVAGRVAKVFFDVGDSVAQQAQLAALDQQEFELEVTLAKTQLVQARAALGLGPDDPLEQLSPQKSPPVREAQAVWDEAKTRTQRMQRLLPKNAVTQEDLDAALAAERVAEARHASAINGVLERIAQIRVRGAELALAEQRLADTVVVAPFEGQVQQRHIAPGTFVQIGAPIVTLVRTGTLRYRGTLPERHARDLAIGQQVRLAVETIDEPLTAAISRISPVVEESNRSLMFEVSVPNPDGRLRTGMFVQAEVFLDPSAQAIVIPPAALSEFAGAEKVWKVVDGAAQEQVVTTGRRSAAGIEITSGLSAGDVILTDASRGRVARVQPPADSSAAPEPSTPASAPTISVTEASSNDQ